MNHTRRERLYKRVRKRESEGKGKIKDLVTAINYLEYLEYFVRITEQLTYGTVSPLDLQPPLLV